MNRQLLRQNQKDIHCWLPLPIYRAIKECAAEEAVTHTQLVKEAIKEYLRDKHGRRPPFWGDPKTELFKMQRPKTQESRE